LSLEVAKAREVLGVRPRWRLEQAVERTMKWYRARRAGADALALCRSEVVDYEALH
jgi:CDP-glucose 4,6-dehydratase